MLMDFMSIYVLAIDSSEVFLTAVSCELSMMETLLRANFFIFIILYYNCPFT
jgi:hypothetical protein